MTLQHLSQWFSKPIDVTAELARVPREAESMANQDGRRELPTTASGAASPAMIALMSRGWRLMHNVTTVFGGDLERTHHDVGAALQRYERAVTRLPEAVRRAKSLLDAHWAQVESRLLQTARQAAAAQRTRRAEEMLARRSFSSADAGSSSLLAAALLIAIVVEIVLSSLLTADNNPAGFLGSLVLFATLTAVNYAIAFQSGLLVRALWDRRDPTARLAAGAVMVVFLGVMIGLHTVVAKFRELTLSGGSFEAAMRDAVGAAREAFPTELSSLTIGLIGLLCGLGAFACGYRRAATERMEREAHIAVNAEHTLREFDSARAEWQLQTESRAALAELDTLDTEVEAARSELATALQAWVSRRDHLGALQEEIVRVHDDAAELYEACVSTIRNREPSKRRSKAGVVPLRHAADSGYIDAARRATLSATWMQDLERARAELHRHGAILQARIGAQLAKWDDSLYNDEPATGEVESTPPSGPDPKLERANVAPATMQLRA